MRRFVVSLVGVVLSGSFVGLMPAVADAATALPNLTVGSIGMIPTAPAVGQAVTFSTTIKNAGAAATTAGVVLGVAFKVDGVEVSWSDTYSTSIPAGASVTLTANGGPVSASWIATAGTHTVTAVADDVNRIAESNESDNSLSATLVPRPNLVADSGFEASTLASWPHDGDPSFSGEVLDTTAADCIQGKQCLSLTEGGGEPGSDGEASQQIPTTPGHTYELDFQSQLVNAVDGPAPVGYGGSMTAGFAGASVGASLDSSVPSSRSWRRYTLTATAKSTSSTLGFSLSCCYFHGSQTWRFDDVAVIDVTPDLIVTGLSSSPASPVAGQAVTFSATVKNIGAGATPAGAIIGVPFLVDGVEVSWSDTDVTSLAPGASVTLVANNGPKKVATWVAVAGKHTLSTTVDDANRIVESNETNNGYSTSFTVVALPDLVVTGLAASPAKPVAGQAVTFSATVKNIGAGATPAGAIIGVPFLVDGVEVSWSDTDVTSLAPGASVSLVANNGPKKVATWVAVAGKHTLSTTVDDANRIVESNETNNGYSVPFNL